MPLFASISLLVMLAIGDSSRVPPVRPDSSVTTFRWAAGPPNQPFTLITLFGDEADFLVTTGPTATSVSIATSTLRDHVTKRSLPTSELYLRLGDGQPQDTLQIPASTKARVVIGVKPAFWANGSFQGAVLLNVKGKPDLDAVSLSVERTTRWAQMGGVICIVAGVLLWFFSTVYLRQRAAHDEALLPARQIAERVETIAAQLATVGASALATSVTPPLGATRTVLSDVRGQLTTSSLEALGYVPQTFRNPYATDSTSGGAYRQFLTDTSGLVAALGMLVDGMGQIAQGPASPAAAQALLTLDSTALAVRGKGANAVVIAAAAVQTALSTAAVTKAPPTAPPAPTVEQILKQIQNTSVAFWIIWGIIATLGGASLMVLNHDGFGTIQDYLTCFLWGAGVQAIGSQLQHTMPTVTGTALNVTFGH